MHSSQPESGKKPARIFQCRVPETELFTAEGGSYCTRCEKQLRNFSGKSASEIREFLGTTTGQVCGEFRSGQVHSVSPLPAFLGSFRYRPFARMASAMLLFALPAAGAYAQNENTTDASGQEISLQPQIISGKVSAEGYGRALPGLTVSVRKQDSLIAMTETDAQGMFYIMLQPGEHALTDMRLYITRDGEYIYAEALAPDADQVCLAVEAPRKPFQIHLNIHLRRQQTCHHSEAPRYEDGSFRVRGYLVEY